MDTLKRLWNSSTGLIKRFNIDPPVDVVFKVFREEVQEFQDALFSSGNLGTFDMGSPTHEGADVIVTVLNTLSSMGYTYEQIEQAINDVIAKNDAKTWQTHYINDAGKIQRRGRL